MTETVYLVVEVDSGDSYETKRVYRDEAAALAFAEAYNLTSEGFLDVVPMDIGAPDVPYDGPVWLGTWTTRRKLVGEKLIVADGFPATGDRFGPSWQVLAGITPEYEEPPVWIDRFYYRQKWQTGDNPTPAAVTDRREHSVEVTGTSKDAVDQLLRETALQVKAALQAGGDQQ